MLCECYYNLGSAEDVFRTASALFRLTQLPQAGNSMLDHQRIRNRRHHHHHQQILICRPNAHSASLRYTPSALASIYINVKKLSFSNNV